MTEELLNLEKDGEAAEIILGKPPRFVRFSLYLTIALIVTAIMWAYWSKIDIVISAPGVVRPQGDLLKVQSLLSGRLLEVHAKEGEIVQEGAVLFRIDGKEGEAELAKAKSSRERAAIAWNDANVQFESARRDLDRTKKLLNQGVFSQAEFEKKEDVWKNAEATRERIQAELRIAEQEEEKLALAVGHLEIKAPRAGLLTSVLFKNAGEIVSAGAVLATIAAENSPAIVEAMMSNKDVGPLREGIGSRVKLKFDAFPFRDYGLGEGKLLAISPDAIADPKLGLVYRVQIGMDSLVLHRGRREGQIQLGMTVQAEVIKEEERILYLLFKEVRDRLAYD